MVNDKLLNYLVDMFELMNNFYVKMSASPIESPASDLKKGISAKQFIKFSEVYIDTVREAYNHTYNKMVAHEEKTGKSSESLTEKEQTYGKMSDRMREINGTLAK